MCSGGGGVLLDFVSLSDIDRQILLTKRFQERPRYFSQNKVQSLLLVRSTVGG